MRRMWIEMDGLANLRDVGGLPTTEGGTIRPRRLLRSDNLQSLSADDIETLLELGHTDVIDMRSDYEVAAEGPGPLSQRTRDRHPPAFAVSGVARRDRRGQTGHPSRGASRRGAALGGP